jgi:hypothetical protein
MFSLINDLVTGHQLYELLPPDHDLTLKCFVANAHCTPINTMCGENFKLRNHYHLQVDTT